VAWREDVAGGNLIHLGGTMFHPAGECRDVNIAKAKLEGLFVDELARLQPSAGYMGLVKERVVQAWDKAKSDVKEKAEAVERRIKAIRQRIDRLDNAFLYEQSIEPMRVF
jgi:hypothetical protein